MGQWMLSAAGLTHRWAVAVATGVRVGPRGAWQAAGGEQRVAPRPTPPPPPPFPSLPAFGPQFKGSPQNPVTTEVTLTTAPDPTGATHWGQQVCVCVGGGGGGGGGGEGGGPQPGLVAWLRLVVPALPALAPRLRRPTLHDIPALALP